MARPRLELDTEMIEKLAAVGCTDTDIAYIMKCSIDTLNRRFQEYLDSGRARGRTRLRNKQYEVAMSGNTAMLIWLGKQMLGQSDRQEISNTGPVQVRLNWGNTIQKIEAEDLTPRLNSADSQH